MRLILILFFLSGISRLSNLPTLTIDNFVWKFILSYEIFVLFYEKFVLSYGKYCKCVCSAAVRVDTLALASLKKTNWMKFTHEIIFPAASFLHVSLILWQLPKLGCGRH